MAAERAQHILVIGIGNAESGDDGADIVAVKAVRHFHAPRKS